MLSSELNASLTASTFAILASLLGGAFMPLAKMPEGMQLLSNLTFTKWLIAFTSVLEQGSVTLADLFPLSVIMGMGIGFLLLAMVLSKRKFAL